MPLFHSFTFPDLFHVPPSRPSPAVRLRRVRGRPVFVAGECVDATQQAMTFLNSTGVDLSNFTVRGLGFIDHCSHWPLRPDPMGTRAALRQWVGRVLSVAMPPTPPPSPLPTPALPTPKPPTPAPVPVACDTRNASITVIVIAGASIAGVNGRYQRSHNVSDGFPVFSLDETHQLYRRGKGHSGVGHLWRLAYWAHEVYYISSKKSAIGPPVPNEGEWSAVDAATGAPPSSITCE